MPRDIDRPPVLHAGTTIPPQVRPVANDPHSPAARFNAILAAIRWVTVIPADPDPVGDQLRQLRGVSMHDIADAMSETLKYTPPTPTVPASAKFNPGFGSEVQCSATAARLLAIDQDEARAWLARHAAGDHGVIGPDSAVGIRNAEAIRSGDGMVVSRFDVYRPDTDAPKHNDTVHLEPRRRRNRGEYVDVVSLLTPGRPPRTILLGSLDHIRAI
jgi:hypothetical protein